MNMSAAWATSARYFFSRSTWLHMGAQLRGMLVHVGVATSFLISGMLLSYGGVRSIAWLLQLPPPLLAICTSPLYVPPLLQRYETTDKRHVRRPYILSGLVLYGGCAGIYALFVYGPLWAKWGLEVLGIVLSPVLLGAFICSPVAALAYAYAPMSFRSHTKIWLHAMKMTVGEFPFIALLFLGSTPLGALLYVIPYLLCAKGLLPAPWVRPCVHVASIAYWQVGWAAFMIFYQQQKHRYLKNNRRRRDDRT